MNQELSFVNGKMRINGVHFYKNKTYNDKFFWICHLNKSTNCPANALTELQNGNHILLKFKDHDHEINMAEKVKSTVYGKLKDRAKNSNDKATNILRHVINSLDSPSKRLLPHRSNLLNVIYRTRNSIIDSEPTSINDINLTNDLIYMNDEPFVINQVPFRDELLIFMSRIENLKFLENSSFWIMDGTFSIVPSLFYQLYSIHCEVKFGENEVILPMAYFLMTGKTKDLFDISFKLLIEFAEEHGYKLEPNVIIGDFEEGPFSAISQNFRNTTYQTCFFHLCKIILRKVKNLKLSYDFSHNSYTNEYIRCLPALAFFPPLDIKYIFEILKEEIMDNQLKVLFEWFEENYINGRILRIVDGTEIRSSPTFHPGLWSVFERNDSGIPRTQNSVEGWHSKLKNLVKKSNLGLHKLIMFLQDEQKDTDNKIQCLVLGQSVSKVSQNMKKKEQALKNVFETYSLVPVMNTLKAFAANIKLT